MPESPLLFPHLEQLEVDFVIPLRKGDLPLCIDPFLLYKSRDPELRLLHTQIVDHFVAGMTSLAARNQREAEHILTFPEVSEVGLGYGTTNKRGSGLGGILRGLLIDTLKASPAILERGIRHVEEMQLLSPGIGPDRIGDIASNILKEYLIAYTQRQCAIHNIPVQRDLPIGHVYDAKDRVWCDGYYDLPANPDDGGVVLLVPRRIVRQLPWINYDNFVRTEFRAYLAAKRGDAGRHGLSPSKDLVTSTSRVETVIIDNYVRQREQQSAEAQPFIPSTSSQTNVTGDALRERLANTPVGHGAAADYQQLVLDVITFVFFPDLIDGRLEERTIDGTGRRDIIFTNDSDASFFDYVRNTHDALMIMFEVKKVADLSMPALNQSATYLGDRIGRLGFIVTRHSPGENLIRKQISIFNDSNPKKILLILSDADLIELIDLRVKDASPVKWLQKRYRDFRTAVQ
jgi:hypothetical protein